MYGFENPPAFGSETQKPTYGGAPGGGEFYGSAPPPREGAGGFFKRVPRRRLNVVPIFMCLLVPWVMFAGLYAALAFSMHYFQQNLTRVAIVLSLLCVLASVAYGAKLKMKRYLPQQPEAPVEPTWAVALALLLVIAWLAAFFLGDQAYHHYTQPYYDIMSFNSYNDVRTDTMRGEQLMDAGIVTFSANTTLDYAKAVGFKNGDTYCVAPIVRGTATMQVYDFWAVGTNCCSSTTAEYRCHDSDGGRAGLGAVRLMDDNARAFYRLAVQEAEAQYSIKANHPVFFTWEPDPVSVLENWRRRMLQNYVLGVLGHFIFQAFAVTSLTLFFSRLGQF
jgi:hypothetical protein